MNTNNLSVPYPIYLDVLKERKDKIVEWQNIVCKLLFNYWLQGYSEKNKAIFPTDVSHKPYGVPWGNQWVSEKGEYPANPNLLRFFKSSFSYTLSKHLEKPDPSWDKRERFS